MPNKKILDINVRREIESIPLGYGIVAYKDLVIANGQVLYEEEGLTKEKHLNVSDLEKIKPNKSYYLLNEYDIEQIRINADYYPKKIVTPYTSFLNGKDYLLTIYDSGYEAFRRLNGVYLPKPIYFDYNFGYIDDSRFDLDELKDYLKKFPDKFYNIQKRPYGYHYEWKRKYELSFYWISNEEEFNEYINICNGDYDLNRKIAIKFLGLDQFRI